MKLVNTLFIVASVFFAKESIANCIRVTSTSSLSSDAIAAGYTASSWTGASDTANSKNIGIPSVISLSSGTFQDAGTLLASSTLDFISQALSSPFTAQQVLFRCAVADADSIYEMYATNGDNAYSGMYTVGDIDNAYYSYVKNVAFRLTNTKTGNYYTRYWQSRKLTADDWYSDGTYIYVPASAFSGVTIELFRTESISYYGNTANTYSYGYSQPFGYIDFKGPGVSANITDGADSANHYDGFYAYWPAGWSLYNTGTTFVRGAMCKVNDYPSVVTIPSISVPLLASGTTSQASFTVSIECESGAVSSTATSTTRSANVSMGFLVNNPIAVSAAQSLGLTTSSGGLTWLLDDDYGTLDSIASGVGIRIYSSNGTALNLLPSISAFGTGNPGGWYAFGDITSLQSSGTTNIYSGEFIASLEAISGQTITAGSVNAQLQVVVSFQ